MKRREKIALLQFFLTLQSFVWISEEASSIHSCTQLFWSQLNQAVPIIFDHIPATNYELKKNQYTATVQSSSSFLLLPFKSPCHLDSFTWQIKVLSGKLNLDWQRNHTQKSGDDAIFRLGCLIGSDSKGFISWFAPSWAQSISKHMFIYSDQITYLTFGPPNTTPSKWVSPYSEKITSQLVPLAPSGTASYHKKSQVNCTGLFFGSDGDNTKSTFKVKITPSID